MVWVEALASNSTPSPVLPDLSLPSSQNVRMPAIDWHYSWMFTGYQVSSSGGATFEGNIVIFENRPFGITAVPNPPSTAELRRGDVPGRGRDGGRGDLRPQRQRPAARLWCRSGPDRALAVVFEGSPTRWSSRATGSPT